MMKNWPRTVMLTLFILLAFTTSASAECAWVLWEQSLSGPKVYPNPAPPFDPSQMFFWTVENAYETRDACQQALKTADERRKTVMKDMTEKMRKENVPPPFIPLKGVCLPDTVDPRGPKGK